MRVWSSGVLLFHFVRDKENARVLGLSLDTVQMVAALPMEEFNVRMLYVLTPPFS